MVSVLTYSKIKQELVQLRAIAKEVIAQISEDCWEIKQIYAFEELRKYLSEKPIVHMIIYDICDKTSLEFLLEMRKVYVQARIMLLADTSVSPMEYIKPGLRASSLLLRPWTRQQAYNVLYDFLIEYIDFSEREKGGQDFWIVETREGTINIPFEQIYFFEAREKKIYVCTGKEDYGFYSTMDKLAVELPDNFIRCHRGFIVNTKKIRKIVLSKNIIYLSEDFAVPLSRSYKAALKKGKDNGSG